jgi:hypothetical protein
MRARLPLLYSVLAFAILMGPQAARATVPTSSAICTQGRIRIGLGMFR